MTKVYRFWVMGILLLGCVGLEYYFHTVRGTTIVYTHLFYFPIVVASFWWGLKAGLPVSLFLALMHIALSFPDIEESVLFRSLALVFVGSVTGIISDMRRRAEEALRESEEKYRALYENAPLSYQALDENGCFIDVNPGWLNMLGYQREEVIGKSFADFLHPDSSNKRKGKHAECKGISCISVFHAG